MPPTSILELQQAARNSPIAWMGLIGMLGSVYLVGRLVAWAGIAVALPILAALGGRIVGRAGEGGLAGARLGLLARNLVMILLTVGLVRDARGINVLPALATNLLAATAALFGGLQATIAWSRRVNPAWASTPRPTRGAWIFVLSWIVPLMALANLLGFFSPATWDARAWAMLAAGTIAAGSYLAWGSRRLLRLAGVIRPADDRFRAIAASAAERAGVHLRSIEQVALPMANAFAFIHDRSVAVTDAALAALDDAELEAVCAHEMAHLTEPRWVKAIRLAFVFLFALYLTAMGLIRPIIGTLSPMAVCVSIAGAPVALLVARNQFLRLSHRMEVRADAQAGPAEAAPGVYARALAKIYEMNRTPVVLGMKRQSHPDLYDRLVAAGVTPDYPRPSPPLRGPWRAGFLVLVVGSIAGSFLISDVVARRLPRAVLDPESAALWTTGAAGGRVQQPDLPDFSAEDVGDEDAE